MRVLVTCPAVDVFKIKKLKTFFYVAAGVVLAFLKPTGLLAGGGVVLEDDACVIWIDFYSVHLTAYQPDSSGNQQFCESLPDTGATIFVLDYLHQSLKEVPVGLRIIRDVTGLGAFVKLKHIEEIEDLGRHTVFYQPPVIRADASLKIEHNFTEEGAYIAIITAGHPSKDTVYTAVFPFEVGGAGYGYLLPVGLLLAGGVVIIVRRVSRSRQQAAGSETRSENGAAS